MGMEGSTVLRLEELVHDLLAETSHRGVKSPRRLTPSVFPVNLGLRGHTDLQLFVFYMIRRCNGVFAQHLSKIELDLETQPIIVNQEIIGQSQVTTA